MEQDNIRNFCIIAHINHGKSTLADRMLEITGTVEKRNMQAQILDQMDLERERGITIKLAPVRMLWKKSQISNLKSQNDNENLKIDNSLKIENCKLENSGEDYILNLIDTPGHVDFSYEVSRSLAAVEGAILLVDASQGVEAQTLSNLYAAIEHDLTIIPVLNKIDLPAAKPDEVAEEIIKILGCKREDILSVSGKTGEGVRELLDLIVEKIPNPTKITNSKLQITNKNPNDQNPRPEADQPLAENDQIGNRNLDIGTLRGVSIADSTDNIQTRALIFDSIYDSYRGVVAYVRVFDGKIEKNSEIVLIQSKSGGDVIETGYFSPKFVPHTPLSAGEIGYIVTGFRDVSEARVGDTVTLKKNPSTSPLPGYKKVFPMVYASIYCVDGGDYPDLKVAIEKLKLNDASLTYETEQSPALGFGFRCGFLGLLHLDIVRERLEREYDLSLVISSPTVKYEILRNDNTRDTVAKPSDMPSKGDYREAKEPWVKLEIFTPKDYIGSLMDAVQKRRAIYLNTEFLDEQRAIIKYEIPLSEVIIDLYDQLKSLSSGYASMNYEILDYKIADLEKVDILIAEEKVDALSFIVHTSKAQSEARRIVEKLKTLIPRQNFEIKIQASIGAPSTGLGTGKIIASEKLSPFRKDVTSGLYGGDVTRKNKLLDKQKKGKKKMKQIGRVELPTDVFIKVLRNE